MLNVLSLNKCSHLICLGSGVVRINTQNFLDAALDMHISAERQNDSSHYSFLQLKQGDSFIDHPKKEFNFHGIASAKIFAGLREDFQERQARCVEKVVKYQTLMV